MRRGETLGESANKREILVRVQNGLRGKGKSRFELVSDRKEIEL